MKKKIAVMGLNSLNNMGEKFIIQCVEHLLGKSRYECIIIDFESTMQFFKRYIYYFFIVISKLIPIKNIKYKIIYRAVRLRNYSSYDKAIKDVDAIIFGAGSFKYGTQKLWAYYSLAIECAEKYNIPVMFNAMNIQKYDGKDWRCQFLKEHIEKSCVKMITSRDGEKGVLKLKKGYGISENLLCASVGDTAFWINECYGVKSKRKRNIIGINLIDGNIFRRYGNSLTEEQLLEIYNGILVELDKQDIQWELFTNGLKVDYKFGEKLLKRYGNTQIKIHVPNSDIDLINIISSHKMILGARLHASICAYALDIPFIGFVWDEKLLDFSTMAEIEDLFVGEDELSSKEIIKRMDCFQDGLSEYQKEIRETWKVKTKEYIELFLEKYVR